MEQSFKNHARYVPLFHFFVLPALTLNFGWSLRNLARHFSTDSAIASITAIALVFLALCARTFALTVQNRVIRLEMRLRLQQLLPADLQARIEEFRPGQLIALRFACDAELPELARKVLDENLSDKKTIKQLVRDWQADHLRA